MGSADADKARPGLAPAWLEWLGGAALIGLAVRFLAISWRKWPDPLVDFGRELYLPWRLSHGAVLYRDADDFYGPLSQYFNAGLFAVFGPGLSVLVAANLVILGGIIILLYFLFRRSWGPLAALAACGLFISVFACSQFVGFGNFNFVTPYAHEVTHGLLVCLGLVALLPGWSENPTARRSLVIGGLFGLTAVLKPEIMLAAGLVTAAAALQRRKRFPLQSVGAWIFGAALPTLGFAAYFATQVPWLTALGYACRAWLSVATTTRFTADPVQASFLGLDRPGTHLGEHFLAAIYAVLILGAIAGTAWLVDRPGSRLRIVALFGLLIAGTVALAVTTIDWFESGRCLLGLMLLYLAVSAVTAWRETRAGRGAAALPRVLLALLAVALLSRMVLNGRIYQFGFYQAAIAALLVPAVLIGELPTRLNLGRRGRMAVLLGCLGLLVPGVVDLAARSRKFFAADTLPVGEGRDQFLATGLDVEAYGYLAGQTSQWLREASRPGQTLLVLPEGEMINYLTRRPSPVAPFFFFSAATRGEREAVIVGELDRNPPDWVVLVSRDLREYGVQRYGEKPDQGGQILHWVAQNYRIAARLGDDPLDDRKRGALIFRRQADAK